MTKKLNLSSGKVRTSTSAVPTLTVRDPMTGKAVVVRGAGALAGSDFRLRKGVSLLKPIAKQALTRNDKFKAG